jgi:hypothetical protein
MKGKSKINEEADTELIEEPSSQGYHQSTRGILPSSLPDDSSILVVEERVSMPRRTSVLIRTQEESVLPSPFPVSKGKSVLRDGNDQQQRKPFLSDLSPPPPPPLPTRSRASLSRQNALNVSEPSSINPSRELFQGSLDNDVDNDIQDLEERNDTFSFQEPPNNNDVQDLEEIDNNFRFQEASFYASQNSQNDQSKVNTFAPLKSENNSSRAAAKESVAERRRKRARAASQAGADSNNVTHTLNVNLPKKGLDRDTNRQITPSARNNLKFSEATSSNQSSLAPVLTLDGYSDEEASEENIALFSGGSTRSAPKRLLNMKNMIRRVRLRFSMFTFY